LINSSFHPAKGRNEPLKVHAGTTIHLRLVSSCSPVFKDPCSALLTSKDSPAADLKSGLLLNQTSLACCCRCAASLQRGAVSTASLSARQASFFSPATSSFQLRFPAVTSLRGGRLLHPLLFPVKCPVNLFFKSAFPAHFQPLFPHQLRRGARGVLPSPARVKILRHLFSASSENLLAAPLNTN